MYPRNCARLQDCKGQTWFLSEPQRLDSASFLISDHELLFRKWAGGVRVLGYLRSHSVFVRDCCWWQNRGDHRQFSRWRALHSQEFALLIPLAPERGFVEWTHERPYFLSGWLRMPGYLLSVCSLNAPHKEGQSYQNLENNFSMNSSGAIDFLRGASHSGQMKSHAKSHCTISELFWLKCVCMVVKGYGSHRSSIPPTLCLLLLPLFLTFLANLTSLENKIQKESVINILNKSLMKEHCARSLKASA